ncbi:MAG TPA: WXG100 family type VII secretion target, partial [Pseudonocardiaceae bacterium]|nr:WXG100 family type VII secretion target [Pseudonocardiaceae bacterium]
NPTPGTTDPTTGLAGAAPKQPQSPLFGDMFSAGVAAASAAVFGRFGSLIPKVPAFAGKKGATGTSTDGSTPKLGDRTAAASGLSDAKLAGAGAGGAALGGLKGLGGGGIGGLGGMAASAPSASPSMLGASGMTSELAAASGAASGAAAAGAGGMPMMPMMPMGGMMGGGDMGGARRIPPWLVETEDVWGESSSVSPTVIGED